MTEAERELFEGKIVLAADRRKGIWASSMDLIGHDRVKTCGRLPTESSQHTLFSAGLISTLTSISVSTAFELKRRADRTLNKPRLLVTFDDPFFGDALEHFSNGKRSSSLRISKSLLMPLLKQITRFDITPVPAADNGKHLWLRRWAVASVFQPAQLEQLPPALLPVAVQTTISTSLDS